MSLAIDIQDDCNHVADELKYIWTSIGFDVTNWSYTKRGKCLSFLKRILSCRRNHNIFTSGNGLSYPAGGSTSIYVEDDNYVNNN